MKPQSIVSLLGTGIGGLVAAMNQAPIMGAYILVVLVIVRVIDPALAAIGRRLADRITKGGAGTT